MDMTKDIGRDSDETLYTELRAILSGQNGKM